MNIGYSGRLPYDSGVYPEHLDESVEPGRYRLRPHRIYNQNCCLSTLGPRASYMGYGNSTPSKRNVIAPALFAVDVESELSNRNLKNSRLRNQEVNFIDPKKFKFVDAEHCNHFLDPVATRQTDAPWMYRELAVNRFVNPNKDPQENIYYDDSHNTRLEAKDNLQIKYDSPIEYDQSLPPLQRQKHIVL